jgi:hypothetical protein
MLFRVTVTLRASCVESWVHRVHQEFLDHAPENSKCIGLDCEYTDIVKNVRQKDLPPEKRQRAAVLQLSVASETGLPDMPHGCSARAPKRVPKQ